MTRIINTHSDLKLVEFKIWDVGLVIDHDLTFITPRFGLMLKIILYAPSLLRRYDKLSFKG